MKKKRSSLAHPDVQRPWSDWSEDQTLHVAVAYSNPFRWQKRRTLMNNFRRHIASFPNIVLHVGELAYGDRPFEVTGDPTVPFAEHDIQFRTTDELWHKENLLNAIIARFPRDWKYGAWSDADFTFTRHDWALETIHLLQHYDFVQLFSSYGDLSAAHEPYGMARSFAWNYHNQAAFRASRTAQAKRNAVAHGNHTSCVPGLPTGDTFPFGVDPGAPGLAWAFTRRAIDTVGRLLDVNILGAGDSEMAHGLIGDAKKLAARAGRSSMQPRAELASTPDHAAAVLEWQRRAITLGRNFYYLEHHALHHFHGSKSRRQYYERWAILREHQFNPYTDLAHDWQGIWRWSGNKPALREAVRRYFRERTEDDPNLYGHEKPMV